MRKLILLMILMAQGSLTWADLETERAAAAQAAAESRFDDAVALYAGILEQQPDDGASRYALATALMNLDRLNEAAAEYEAAEAAGFQPLGVGFRLARIRARQGDFEAALDYLDEIAAGGFPIPAMIENEPDFNPLRDNTRFDAALERIRANRFPCRANPRNREFDFWVGQWAVTALGQPAGTNEVKLILGDCVVFENWESVTGTSGKSFNFYDASKDHWRQIWVDDTGGVIEFTGQVRDGVLYYTAETSDPSTGTVTLHKLTFTPNSDGSVRQLWEQSTDDGASWQTVFDGHYTPS